MTTIVNKLFNLVQPDYACFGKKDFQQLAIVNQMVNDLALPVEIIPVEIVRNGKGLALSSRNSKLSSDEIIKAPLLAKAMNELADNIQSKAMNCPEAIEKATTQLNRSGFKVDAIDIVDSMTLNELNENCKQAVILVAAYLGKIRLIDNKVVNLN